MGEKSPLWGAVYSVDPPTFYHRAKCRGIGPKKFFGDTSNPDYCQNCPVINQCLAYALENRIMFGVWGGTSEEERRLMLGLYRR